MTAALLFAAGSGTLFVLFSWLFSVESRRGGRLLLAQKRAWLDEVLESVSHSFERKIIYIGRYIITLSWYYSLHAFLKLVLQFLASIYTVVERILHKNRDKARVIRTERKRATRSHLTDLHDHKQNTKLTETQKKKRKDAALRGR